MERKCDWPSKQRRRQRRTCGNHASRFRAVGRCVEASLRTARHGTGPPSQLRLTRGSACCCVLRPSGLRGSLASHPRQAQEAERLRARLKEVEDALAAKETSERELHERTEKQAPHCTVSDCAALRSRPVLALHRTCSLSRLPRCSCSSRSNRCRAVQQRNRSNAMGGRPIRAVRRCRPRSPTGRCSLRRRRQG